MATEYGIGVATEARLLRRSCDALIGICGGVIADGVLNDVEIAFLRTWLAENPALCQTWPGEIIYRRVSDVLADGIITEDERSYLVSTLQELVGGSFSEDGAIPTGASGLPLDKAASVHIPGRSFCFTGQFIYGTRSACERAVIERGGTVSTVKKSLHYLVVGDMASRDWRHQSFGTKIEHAMELKSTGHSLSVISESQWAASL
jgi:hypothetical protein